MTDPVLVLDSGVLDRVTTDPELRTTVRDLLATGLVLVVPTVVLAEATTGRPADAPVNQLVARTGTDDTTQPLARLAGRLRYAAQRGRGGKVPGAIDAIVAAHAAAASSGVVFTTDPADLRRLLVDYPKVAVEMT